MIKKYILILLMGMIFMRVPALFAADDFDFENWPGKNGLIRANIEFPVGPFLGYGITIHSDLIPWYLWLNLQENSTMFYGEIKIDIYPTIEEAQRQMLWHFYYLQVPYRLKRLLNSPIGDVVFGLDNKTTRSLFFTRANVMVQIESLITNTKAYDELPEKIDAIIQNSPIWKQGDPRPQLIVSEEFKKAFPSPPR
ncbi:MAG: hypothetical protein Q8O92_06375 [Candidatus Latescibacter sp.]|nr:hypothetical protein [Candidatus Latescibacter sp.]